MPLSVDEVIQIGKQKGIDMTKYEAPLRQKYGASGIPDEQEAKPASTPAQPKGVTSSPDINSLIARASGRNNVGVQVGDAITRLGGGTPSSSNTDLSKVYAEQAIKKQFEDPRDAQIKDLRVKNLQAGLDTDAEGNPIRVADTQRDEREKRMKSFEGRRQATTLRGELNQNAYIKSFQEVNRAAQGIDAILQDTLSRPDNTSKNVGDQALITLYNKILDPLSVVRESEYARTPEGQALLNRIQGFVEKVKAGGSGLTDADRIEIGRAAKTLINESGNLYNSKLDNYTNLSDQYEIDPMLVTSGFDRFTPYQLEQVQSSGQPNGQSQYTGSGQTKSGNKFRKVS